MAPTGSAAAMLLLTFKTGLVRENEHVAINATSLALIAFAPAPWTAANCARSASLALAYAFTIDDGVEWIGPKPAIDHVVALYTIFVNGAQNRSSKGKLYKQQTLAQWRRFVPNVHYRA